MRRPPTMLLEPAYDLTTRMTFGEWTLAELRVLDSVRRGAQSG
ncbi:hypothetical protein [Intrasporangium oryzae]|nr:hypothetical protein [Intrasporangium oryzae]